MRKLVAFQVYQDVAAQQAVVKDQIDVEMVVGWGGMYANSKSKKEKEPEILDYFEKQGVTEDEAEIELEEAEVPQAEAGEAG